MCQPEPQSSRGSNGQDVLLSLLGGCWDNSVLHGMLDQESQLLVDLWLEVTLSPLPAVLHQTKLMTRAKNRITFQESH